MTHRELRASGLEYLRLATALLQRARLADPDAGLWEAADLQWWWRTPRASDAIEQLFWADDAGPVAAVVLTDWGESWGCDPLVVPGASTPALAEIWARGIEAIEELGLEEVEVLARDDHGELSALLAGSGFVAGEDRSAITWMEARDRPAVAGLPAGFHVVDRTQRGATAHPLGQHGGAPAEERLRQASLYDPALDLAVEAPDGEVAGYALFWFDPVTEVGLVEPMRVEDAYQRRGLGRALLTTGLERLAARGARRLKVGYATEAARRLYIGAGFRPTVTTTPYRRVRAPTRSGRQEISPRE